MCVFLIYLDYLLFDSKWRSIASREDLTSDHCIMPQRKGKGGNKKKGGRSPHKNSPKRSRNKSKKSPDSVRPHKKSPNNAQSNGSTANGSSSAHSSKPQSPAMSLKTEGNEEFQQQHYDKAIALYTEAIALEPENHTLYSNRSAAYKLSGDFQMALEDADKCIELQPQWAKGYVRKGTVFAQQNQLEDAETVYQLALKVCSEKEPIRVCHYAHSALFAILRFGLKFTENAPSILTPSDIHSVCCLIGCPR